MTKEEDYGRKELLACLVYTQQAIEIVPNKSFEVGSNHKKQIIWYADREQIWQAVINIFSARDCGFYQEAQWIDEERYRTTTVLFHVDGAKEYRQYIGKYRDQMRFDKYAQQLLAERPTQEATGLGTSVSHSCRTGLLAALGIFVKGEDAETPVFQDTYYDKTNPQTSNTTSFSDVGTFNVPNNVKF